ncbi:MAG: Ig-like domain-containing protein [Bifidobacteriaceae bacterium]|nr:Ig-like domain-containing protein [Bifidobacteriaceae bacterium]
MPITLKLEAVGAAPADGAYFADTGTTQTECITTDSGRCNYVTIVGAAAGTYRLTAEPHDALGGLATAELYFADPVQEPEPPDEPRSGTWIEATDLESVKEADHGLSEGAVGYAAPWDFYTVHTQLLDAQGAPLGGLADQLEYEWYAKDYYCASWLYGYQGRGLVFGETTEVSGETGHYTVPVYSNQSCHAGIEVFLETDETWEEIYPQDEDLSTLEVTFVPLSRIDPDNSGMFRLTTSGYADWDEEAWNESPEGTNSVQYLLRLRDANGSDLVTDFTSDEPAFDFSDAVTLAAASPPTLHLSVADRVYVSRVNGEGVASAGILAYFGTTLAGELCPRVIVTLPGANPLELSCDAPVLIYAGDIDVNRSSVTVSQTLGQPANHDDQAASAETWGRQTITATVRDAQGNPANRYVYLTAQAAVGDPYNGSALYFDPEGFVCSVAEDDLGCPTGIYTLAVYSGRSGYRAITVGPDWRDAEKFRNGDYPAHTTLWAPFVGEVSPLASTLEVTPAEGPDAVPSQIALGQPYTVTVTAWDATQVNRIGAQLVELTLTGDNCTAAFPDGQASLTRFTSETGQVTTTVTASTISQCDLTARLAGTELSGSPKALQWDSLEPDPHAAGTYFFVGPDPLPANGVQTGTVTVQLESASGVPATGGARRLRIGQARSDLVLSGFEPTAAGTYTATVKGTLAQPVALTVYLDEAPLNVQDGASNVVNFVNAALSAQDSTFTIPTKADAKIVAQEFHEPRVTLRDVSGNLYVKESVQVTFQYRLVPASGYQPGAWQTGERVWSDTATGVASWPGFTRQTAGEYQVRAVLTNGSTPIPDTDSIITVRFVGDEAIAASPSRFGISGTDRLATGDDPYIAWVVLTDQYGNPAGPGVEVVFTVDANAVGGDAVTMSPPDGKTETCDFDAPAKPTWCTERGKAQVSITSTAPGSIDVSASLNSEIINGAPQTVSFVVDRIDLDRSSYTLTPGATVAAGSGNYTLTVTVVSAMGILVPEAAVRINGLSQYLTQTPAGEGTTGLPDQTTYGTYTWELTSTRAGLYIATVQVYTTTGWENLTRGSVRFSFVPGEPCPSCSTLSVPTATDPLTGAPTLTVEAGTNHTAEVLVRDAYGNVAYDQAARVVFSYQDISSPAGVIGSSDEVPTNGFGVAEWSFTSPVAATWQVSARLVGTTEDVAGSPTTASFHAPRDPTVYASWRLEPVNDAAVKADGQDAFRVTVAIRTGDGRGLPGEPVTLQLPSRVTANPEGPYTTDANGLVILTLQSTWAGNYQIRAATGEPPTDLDAATITFVMPQPVSGPGLTRLVAPGGAVSADATQTQTVLAYVTDSTGAPIKGAPVTFTLADGLTAPAAPGQSEVTLTTGEAGTAELAVTANRPDLFDITATAAGTPITEGSPVQLRFTNAPLQAAASQLELVGGAWVVSATDPGGVVRARLFDELGNPFTDAAQVTFAYRAAGDTTWTQGATVEAARGIAEWDSFAQTTAGRYEVQASVADQLIGSPVSVTFSPGPVDEAASLATLTLASAPAAPGASIGLPVTIWLQDAYGNAVPDATVVFELVYDEPTGATFTTGAKTWSGPANQDGMATASVISDVEGSFAVRARVGSSWSSEPYGVVQFVADTDTADPARSEFTAAPSPTNQLITGALADGADSYTVTILVRGTRGGELADVGGLVQVEPLFAGPTTRSLPFTTGADGRATVTVATTLAGSYRIGVRLGEAPLATTAGGTIYGIDAQFTPGPPTAGAALSRLVAPSEAAPADGQTAQTVTAYLFDAFGNAIAGAPVVFAVPDGLTAGLTAGQTPGPATVAVYTNAAGVAELAFTASAQDTYEVTATSGSFVFLEVAAIRFEDNVAPQPPSVNPTNGQRLAGAVHADDLPDAARGTLIAVVVTPGTGEVVTRALVAPDGTFEAPLGDLAHATDLHVHIQDAAGNRSGATPVTVDGAAPATSVLVPFDGSAIQGSGAEVGATVSVRDEQGYALCTPAVVVGSDGTWQCQLTPPAAPGETITVVTTDTAGNATTQTWRVGLPQLVFLAASVAAGSPAHLTGANFQPGEQIVGTMYSDPVDLGSVAADGSGALVFDWTVPADAAVGEHTVELVGALSGKVTATFTVTPAGGPPKPTPTASSTPSVPNTPSPTSRDRAESLPLTGPNVAAPLATAILAISLGAGMAASRRRRSAEAAERGR